MKKPASLLPSCLAGGETEFAVSAFDKAGNRVPPSELCKRIVALAGNMWPSLPSTEDKGYHLPNSGKIYCERGGAHDFALPEYASPEASDPFELTRQMEAGNLMMSTLCRKFKEDNPHQIRECHVFRHNVCHIHRNSRASHLNVLTISPIETLVDELVPHLVSKLVYAGAGGFDVATGEFSLAPRLAMFDRVLGHATTHNRPLLNNREMSHCSIAARRQHLICSEQLCSTCSRVLDTSTILLMRMIDAGEHPGKAVALEDPIGALQVFCQDVSCSRSVPRAGGKGRITALEIQRHYLESAMACLDRYWMPQWAAKFCRLWDTTLRLLEEGPLPEAVCDRLDWATRLVVFQEAARRHGGDFRKCRDTLLELDLRYGQLEGGLFEQLNLSAHRVPGVDRIDEAALVPPPDTRARPRGDAVVQMHRDGIKGSAHWSHVADETNGRRLDLGNPFEIHPEWK